MNCYFLVFEIIILSII